MSRNRTITDFPRNEPGLVDKFIGTAYDTVKRVGDSLPELQRLDGVLGQIEDTATVIAKSAVTEAMVPVRAELTEISNHVDGVADSIQENLLVNATTNLLTAKLTENMPTPDMDTLTGFAGRGAYMLPTRKAFSAPMVAGTNVVPMASLQGQSVNPKNATRFNVMGLRNNTLVNLNWTYISLSDSILIEEAVNGDILLALEQDVGIGDLSLAPISVDQEVASLNEWLTSFKTSFKLLASIEGPAHGAGMVGYAEANEYAPNTLGWGLQSLISALQTDEFVGTMEYNASNTYPAGSVGAAIAEVDTKIQSVKKYADLDVFGNAAMRTRVRSSISSSPAIYILGDSISHGAFARDAYRNSWPNILKRCLNAEFGVNSYGFVPLLTMGNGVDLTQDIHEIAFVPQSGWSAREAATGSYVPHGLSYVSTGIGNALSSTIPTFMNRAYIWYIGNPGGGTFDIKVNGTVMATVNTSAATVTPINVHVVSLTADQAGFSKIECVTTSAGKVELCGFSYVGPTNTTMVNNFSNSGRRLRWVDESVIKAMMEGSAMFIMALGYNDSGNNASDPAYFAEFKQRIDWLIQYANQFEVPVVVPDFCWVDAESSVTRMELKRLADQTKGVYIPFPDMFEKSDGPSSDLYRFNVLKLFVEGAHPNVAGHRYIAETIAKKLCLGVNTKKQALDFYDWWMPLKIEPSGMTALGHTADNISAVRNNGGAFLCRMNLNGLGVGSATARDVCFAWPTRSGVSNAFIGTFPMSPLSNGKPTGTVILSAGGKIVAQPTTDNNSTSNLFMFTSPAYPY